MERTAPGASYGHIVEAPGFGKVSLAKLTVHRAFHLTMMDADTRSSGGGAVNGPIAMANGPSAGE
ncbi:MAG: hypothetical protein WCB11_07500 [Terriglobales bacterium]